MMEDSFSTEQDIVSTILLQERIPIDVSCYAFTIPVAKSL